MQATIEKVSNLERRLNVALPAQEIDTEVQSRLKRLARSIKMDGFRPGKVPFRLVQQQYGMQVRNEVLSDALQKSFGEAVRQENLRVAGYPRFEAKPDADATQQFEFSATFEVYPEVAIDDLAATRVERPILSVGTAEVDKTVEVLRKQRATQEVVDREAKTGDVVTIDYSGTIDGQEFEGGAGSDHSVALGEGRLLADFESAIAGLRPGAQRKFELTFPEDYHGRQVAGKTAVFEVTLKQVSQVVLPEVDAEFARQLGVADGSIEQMRKDVQANLEREVRRRIQVRVKEQVMNALLAATRMELPKALVEQEVERLTSAMRQDLERRGVKTEQLPMPSETFEAEARRRVSLGLIVAELARRENLQARPEQLRALVQDYAESYERPDEVVRWYYQSQDRLREVESLALENNVVDWALSRVKVEDKPADFDELMGNRK